MIKKLALSLTLAGLCAMPAAVLAQDPVPPKPPGGTEAPKPPGDKPAGARPEGRRPGGPGGGERKSPEDRLKEMTEKLGLNQDQQDKIKAVHQKYTGQIQEIRAKGREKITEEDRTKMRELFQAQGKEIAAVLTPEQRQKMNELYPEGRRPGGPGGDRKPGEGRKPGERKPGEGAPKPGEAK